MNPLDYSMIPKKATLRQRIPIQTIVDAYSLNHSEEKLIRDHTASIYLVAALNESTINIKAYTDEMMVYEEIHIFEVQLKKDAKFNTFNQKLHSLFPNPLLIVYKHKNEYIFSLALKHINRYEKNQTVVDEIYLSDSSSLLDDSSRKFLKTLNVSHIKANHLEEFYLKLINIIYQQRLINIIGDYPDSVLDASKVKNALKDLEHLQAQLNKTKEEARSPNTMRSKMENHIKQKEIESKITNIIANIKEAL